jgi:hypothetical protein
MTAAGVDEPLTSIYPLVRPPQPSMFVVHPPGLQVERLFNEHTRWVRLPTGRSLASRIARIQSFTSWSFRDLAEILGTSHTTVGRLANGGPVTVRSKPAADKIDPLLDVVARLATLVPAGKQLAHALRAPSPSGERVTDALAAGDWARAFLIGLDVIRGPRPKRPQPMPKASRLPATQELS